MNTVKNHLYNISFFLSYSVLNSEDMLVAFCVGHFIAGCVSAYRIFAISNACHNLISEMKDARSSLNEITILKYKVFAIWKFDYRLALTKFK